MPASAVASGAEPPPAADEQPTSAGPAAPARERPRVLRPVLLAAGFGGAQGTLLYGGTIALLHAWHNPLGVWDALVLLAWCLVLYGSLAALGSGAAMLALRLLRRLRLPATSPEPGLRRDLWLATAAYHGVFWVITASYGLTYDEAPGWVTSAWPMLAFLVLRSLGVLLLALLAARAMVASLAATRGRGRALVGWSLTLLVGAQVAMAAWHRPPPKEKPPLPSTLGVAGGLQVAVLGVDGADWRVILPLVEAGQLPNLARLMREGSWGPLHTFPDSNSAVIWASIYSGRRPERHGILDFYAIRLAGMTDSFFGVYPVHRTFFKELALQLQRLGLAQVQVIDRSRVDAPLLWEVAQATGRSVGVVDGYYYSYPAPLLGDPGSFFLSFGSNWASKALQVAGRAPTDVEAGLQAWPPQLFAAEAPALTLPDFGWQTTVLLDLLGRYRQPALVSLYTHEPDVVQHSLWRYYQPDHFFGVDPRRAPADYGVVRFYRSLDDFLGKLQARLDPGTVLVLVSDHGHSPTIVHTMDTQHRHGPPGVLLLHGGPVRAGVLPASANVLDVYPTVLYLLGIPIPDDAAGRLLATSIDPAFLRQHPPQRVASWDGLPPPRVTVSRDENRQRRELEQLIALGYAWSPEAAATPRPTPPHSHPQSP